MTTKRKVYTADFKAKVARDAIRGIKTLEELGSEYGVHPVMVSKWQALLEKNAASIFDKNKDHKKEIEDILKKMMVIILICFLIALQFPQYMNQSFLTFYLLDLLHFLPLLDSH